MSEEAVPTECGASGRVVGERWAHPLLEFVRPTHYREEVDNGVWQLPCGGEKQSKQQHRLDFLAPNPPNKTRLGYKSNELWLKGIHLMEEQCIQPKCKYLILM